MTRRAVCLLLFAALLLAPLLPGAAAEGDTEPEPVLVLEGTLLDATTGDPVVGASVSGHVRGDDQHWSDRTRTDETGAYRLRLGPGHGFLEIHHEAYQSQRAELRLTENHTRDVELQPMPEPAARITGIVMDAAGNPVQGARVYLQPNHEVAYVEPAFEKPKPEPERASNETDATSDEASAEPMPVRLLPPGSYRDDYHHNVTDADGRFAFLAYAGPKHLRIEAGGFAYHQEKFKAADGDNTPLRIELEKVPDATAVVDGTVVDAETGEPVRGAWVSIEHLGWSRHQSATTDEDGRFRAPTIPGLVRIQVNAAGGHYGMIDAVEVPEEVVEKGGGEIAVPAPEPPAPRVDRAYYPWQGVREVADGDNALTVRLTPKAMPTLPVAGWILDKETQKGIPNAWVTLRNDDTGDWGRAQTDENGSFRILVRPGYHLIQAGAEGYLEHAGVLDVRAKPDLLAISLQAGERKWAPCWEDCYHTMHGVSYAKATRAVAEESAPTPASDGDQAALAGGYAEAPRGVGDDSGSLVYAGEGGGLGAYSPELLAVSTDEEPADPGTDATTNEDTATPDTGETDPSLDGTHAVPAPGLALVGIAVTAGAAVAIRRRQP